jgi:hypothetical protein
MAQVPSKREGQSVIVIEKNGKTTVISGWRAWLAAAGVFVVVTAAFWVIAFVLLGVAITVGTILLIVVPVIVGVGIVVSLFQASRTR